MSPLKPFRSRRRRRGAALVTFTTVAMAASAGLVLVSSPTAVGDPNPKLGLACENTATGPADYWNPANVATSVTLDAAPGRISTPEGNSIYMWAFRNLHGRDLNGDAAADIQFSGPTLCVEAGSTLTLATTAAAGIPLTGIFVEGAGNGASVLLTQPGTFEYVGSSDGGLTADPTLEQMGLHGALIVYPAGAPTQILGAAGTAFEDVAGAGGRRGEYLILLEDLDPYFHDSVEKALAASLPAPVLVPDPVEPTVWTWTSPLLVGTQTYVPRYSFINGRAFPDTLIDNYVEYLPYQPYGSIVSMRPYYDDTPLAAVQYPCSGYVGLDPGACDADPIALRMLNAGIRYHPFHTHVNHAFVVGGVNLQDGGQALGLATAYTPLVATSAAFVADVGPGEGAYGKYTVSLSPGETNDALFAWSNVDEYDPVTNPLPTQIPVNQNLWFEGTYYSGSPYLGGGGDNPAIPDMTRGIHGPGDNLPAQLVHANQCGEFYNPWHTHALQEMVNWDGGAGGQFTLLRIDPPGGCGA